MRDSPNIDLLDRWAFEVRKVEKPWGHEVWLGRRRSNYAGKLLYVDAGHELSLQVHREKDETSYLLSGRFAFDARARARI